jgi:hypothetical protein
MVKEISIQLILEIDDRNRSISVKQHTFVDTIIYRFNVLVLDLEPPIEFFQIVHNEEVFLNVYDGGWAFIGKNNLSLDEIKVFLEEFLKGLTGGISYEILCKGSPLLFDYDMEYGFQKGGTFSYESCSRNNSILKDIKLVSAQKGNSFYHEEEVIDLASLKPENPKDFELYMCFHLIFDDGTVEPIYRTWATRNKVTESYHRYVAETQKRILLMYPFSIAKEYDLTYWDNFLYGLNFPVKTKEEALVKYYSMGFDVPNYRHYMTQKLSTLETTYLFNGKIDIIDGVEEYTKTWLSA